MPDPASKSYQPLWQIWQSEPALAPELEQVAALRAADRPFREPCQGLGDLAAMPAGRYPEARPVVTHAGTGPGTQYPSHDPEPAREEAALRLADLLSRGIILLAEEGRCRRGARTDPGHAQCRPIVRRRAVTDGAKSTGGGHRAGTGPAGARPRPGPRSPSPRWHRSSPCWKTRRPTTGCCPRLRGERAALDELLGKVVAGELSRSAIPGPSELPLVCMIFVGSRELCVRIRSGYSKTLNDLVEAARLPEAQRGSRIEAMVQAYYKDKARRGVLEADA